MSLETIEELLSHGKTRQRARDWEGAEQAYLKILAIEPAHAEALHLLGLVGASCGRLSEAIERFEAATKARADYAEAYYNLGRALQDFGKPKDAEAAYTHAISCRPDYAKAINNLGVVQQQLGDTQRALMSYELALKVQPLFPEALFNRATLFEALGRMEEAIAGYRAAIGQKPDYADAQTNLGNALQKVGQFDEAIARLSAISPPTAISLNAFGNALKEVGRLDEALVCYQKAVDAGGGHWAASNYLYTTHFHPAWDARRICDEHAQWNDQYARPLQPEKLSTPHVSNGRKLHIGFVSPDFRAHPVGRFMLPLAKHLDRERFQISYLSDVIVEDATTREFEPFLVPVRRRPDSDVIECVEDLEIDVLIDLTMHMDGNRLLAFAQKPAPLQLTYLAYCSTTGLTGIDYRLSDPYLDPLGMDESVYAEKTLRLADSYWCYRAPKQVMPLARPTRSHVVFGCFNNYCKVSEPTWATWIQILHAVPGSRLLIFCPEGSHRAVALNRLSRAGIDPNRLSMVSRMPQAKYFETYNEIDIALDPFPYGGGTTSLDGLWMGVPLVSLVGETAVGRGGASILNNLGHPEWLASSVQEYVRVAVQLAGHLPDRSELREELTASRLMNEPAFARGFEEAIARAWRDQTGQSV